MKVRILFKNGTQRKFNNVSLAHYAEGWIVIKHGSLTERFDMDDVETMITEEDE